MGRSSGSNGSRVRAWRAWCRHCGKHLAMAGRENQYPDELRCPLCQRWCKVLAVATDHLKDDVICLPGSGRNRVEEK